MCFVLNYQAIVLEGSYWKRRIEVVIKEYHKWRIYHKKRVSRHKSSHEERSCLQSEYSCRFQMMHAALVFSAVMPSTMFIVILRSLGLVHEHFHILIIHCSYVFCLDIMKRARQIIQSDWLIAVIK